jgi:hypothetical protein
MATKKAAKRNRTKLSTTADSPVAQSQEVPINTLILGNLVRATDRLNIFVDEVEAMHKREQAKQETDRCGRPTSEPDYPLLAMGAAVQGTAVAPPKSSGAEELAAVMAAMSAKVLNQADTIKQRLLYGTPPASPSNQLSPANVASDGPLKDRAQATINNLERIGDALFVISEYLGIS